MDDISPDASADHPQCMLEETVKAAKKSFNDFHRQLDGFPHTFQLEQNHDLSADQLRKVRTSLESALLVGYETCTETARARNLLSYVLFRLDHAPGEALHDTEEALKIDKQNIVSLANAAVLLWHQGDHLRAEERVQTLRAMRKEGTEFSYLVVKAKAELAFSYTRFGPSSYMLAQRAFTEVLPDAKEPEVWLWKFGLALTRRRLLKPNIDPASTDQDNYKEVLQMYLDIAANCDSDSLKAKAYAEIAYLLFMPNLETLKTALQKEAGLTIPGACEKALALDSNDHSVLWKCGRQYRYLRKTEISRDLLEKAVASRRTTKAFHNLGLTYKALAQHEKLKQPADSTSTPEPRSDVVTEGLHRKFVTQLSSTSELEFELGISESAEVPGVENKQSTPSSEQTGQIHPVASYFTDQGGRVVDASSSDVADQTGLKTAISSVPTERTSLMSTPIRNSVQKTGHIISATTSDVSQQTGHMSTDAPDVTEQIRRLSTTTLDVTEQTGQLSTSTPDAIEEVVQASTAAPGPTKPTNGQMSMSTSDSKENKVTYTNEMFSFWKMAKSPPSVRMRFSKEDPYVEQAMGALRNAVDVSEWENGPAAYDLALLHASVGDLEAAKEILEKLLTKKSHAISSFSRISTFEQLGLISKDLADTSTSEEERNRLWQYSQSMLVMALKTASEQCCALPEVRDRIGEVWHSFPTLLRAVDNSETPRAKKLREKAILFQLIKKNRQSLALLTDIEKMDSVEGNDPNHMKVCIENYVALRRFEDALAFVDLLQCTAQSDRAMELFQDSRYLHKIYLQAALTSLLGGSPSCKSHFRHVFNDYTAGRPLTVTSSDDTDSENDVKKRWDVMILHDEVDDDVTEASSALKAALRDQCGLKVTSNSEDVLGGENEIEGTFRAMKRSRTVAVVVGRHKLPSQLRLHVTYAARRESTVALLLNDASRLPAVLKTGCRSHLLAPELLQDRTQAADEGERHYQRMVAVCRLFGFLVDIDFTPM